MGAHLQAVDSVTKSDMDEATYRKVVTLVALEVGRLVQPINQKATDTYKLQTAVLDRVCRIIGTTDRIQTIVAADELRIRVELRAIVRSEIRDALKPLWSVAIGLGLVLLGTMSAGITAVIMLLTHYA